MQYYNNLSEYLPVAKPKDRILFSGDFKERLSTYTYLGVHPQNNRIMLRRYRAKIVKGFSQIDDQKGLWRLTPMEVAKLSFNNKKEIME